MTDQRQIRQASEADVPVVLAMIRALAEYEQLSHEVVATEALLTESLFTKRAAEVILAYDGDRAVGFAVYFHNFSTFLGRAGLYLEDLFVLPDCRGRGFGKQLFARVAQIAVERHCGRMEWAVLDWNAPAIGFYKKMAARAMEQWTTFRLTGDALQAAAKR